MKKWPFILLGFIFCHVQNCYSQTYCTPEYENVERIMIRNVLFTSPTTEFSDWQNNTPLFFPGGYADFYDRPRNILSVHPDSIFNLEVRLSVYPIDSLLGWDVKAHFDWDQDGTFDTSYVLTVKQNAYSYFDLQITVPSGAPLGASRMRISAEHKDPLGSEKALPCGSSPLGSAQDFKVLVKDKNEMGFEGLEIKGNSNTIFVDDDQGRYAQLAFNVKTEGGNTNLSLISASASAATSTAQFSDFTVLYYYTGPSPSIWAPTKPLGTRQGFSDYHPQNERVLLEPGDNWFWVVAIINNEAIGKNIDFSLLEITLDSAGTIKTIPVADGNPPGVRTFSPLEYCLRHESNSGRRYQRIDSLFFGDFSFHYTSEVSYSNKSAQNFSHYIDPIHMCQGHSIPLRVVVNQVSFTGSPTYVHAFFDWDQDGNFKGRDEHYYLGVQPGSVLDGYVDYFTQITPPAHAKAGKSMMRIQSGIFSAEDETSSCVNYAESQDFGYELHQFGELTLDIPIEAAIDQSPLNFSFSGTQGSFNFQQSADGINWETTSQNANSSSFSLPEGIESTSFFRLKSTDALCPNSEFYSPEKIIPYLGIKPFTTDTLVVCDGDTLDLDAQFSFPKMEMTVTEGATSSQVGVTGTHAFTFSGLPDVFTTSMIDSICFTAIAKNRESVYLVSPEQTGAIRVKLSANLDSDSLNQALPSSTNIPPAPGRFCYFHNDLGEAVEYGVVSRDQFPGTYNSDESFSRLNGINPNGEWKVEMNTSTPGNSELISTTIYFGKNEFIKWSPALEMEDASQASTRIYPSENRWYTAEIKNHLGTFKDSVFVFVSGQETLSLDLNWEEKAINNCENVEMHFEVIPSGTAPNYSFSWYKNNSSIPNQSSNTLVKNGLLDGDIIRVQVEYATQCIQLDKTAQEVLQLLPEKNNILSMTLSEVLPMCGGDDLELNAFPFEFGNNLEYTWYVNGDEVGANDPSFTLPTPADGDVVQLTVSGDYPCLKVHTISVDTLIDVQAKLVPQLSINPDSPFPVCEENQLTFAADTANFGLPADITWSVNNLEQQWAGLVFATQNLSDGDVVEARITTTYTCLEEGLNQRSISAAVTPTPETNIGLDASQAVLCANSPLELSIAVLENAGGNPAFQWYKNDELIPGETGISLTHNPLVSGDAFKVSVVSDALCAPEDPIFSAPVQAQINVLPNSDFGHSKDNLTYTFTPANNGYTAYNWTFTDGQVSDEMTPEITFSQEGNVEVCLSVEDGNGCVSEECEMVAIVGLEEHLSTLVVEVFPNPMQDNSIQINWNKTKGNYTWHALSGQLISTGDFQGNNARLPCPEVPGVYFLTIQSRDGAVFREKLIRE